MAFVAVVAGLLAVGAAIPVAGAPLNEFVRHTIVLNRHCGDEQLGIELTIDSSHQTMLAGLPFKCAASVGRFFVRQLDGYFQIIFSAIRTIRYNDKMITHD